MRANIPQRSRVWKDVDSHMALLPHHAATSVPAPEDADRRLVVGARAGRGDARDELARRFRRPAYLLALQIVGDPDDALDIAQDAMLRFFGSLARFRDDRPVRPWLFAIVRNRARDLWRRRAARPTEPLDARPDLAAHLAATTPDPEQALGRRERARGVWRAIGALSADHREILVLRDFHDLAYAEIAGVVDIPIGTVMSRLHAARSALRAELNKDEGAQDA